MADGKPGRPKLTDEEKAQNKAWKDAGLDPKTERAKMKAQHTPAVVEPSDDDRFAIVREHEPIIERLEREAKEASDRAKQARASFAKAFGGKVADANDEMKRFRDMQTEKGRARLRADIKAFARVRWEGHPPGHMDDLLESLSETKAIEHKQPEPDRMAA